MFRSYFQQDFKQGMKNCNTAIETEHLSFDIRGTACAETREKIKSDLKG